MAGVVCGIDLGYGRVKLAAPGYRSSFAAVVAEPGSWSDAAGFVEWGSHRFLVGEPALTEPHHRYSARVDKIATPEEMAKYLAALALLSDHYDTQYLQVATGLPPAHYRDAGLKQQLVDRLTGTFAFRYEGRPYLVEVEEVSVDPQAGAALFDYLLLDDGWPDDRHSDLLGERTIIVDPGHRTTDVALMHGRKAAMGGRSILTTDKGVWDVYEEASRLLMAEHRVQKTPAEIDMILRSRDGLRVSGQLIPLADLVVRAAAPVARSVVASVMRHAGDVRLWDRVLLVGGGALLFQQVLVTELSVPIRLPKEPAFANAAGYFKRQLERRLADL